MAYEWLSRVGIALTVVVAVTLRPACIIPAILPVVTRALSIIARTAAEVACIAVIAIARSDVRLPRVVIAVEVVAIAVAAPTAIRVKAFFVARVESRGSKSTKTAFQRSG
jgi:hypothetical protein